MTLNCELLDESTIYKLLTSIVIPRPIAWVSTVSIDGEYNLAPFSFFNVIGHDPPFVMISCVNTNFKLKDTTKNIIDTKEFVVNMVTLTNLEQMNLSAGAYPPEVNEFQLAKVTSVKSTFVKPPMVKESPVSIECVLKHHFCLSEGKSGGSTSLIGEIKMIHINDDLIDDSLKIDQEKYAILGKMDKHYYCSAKNDISVKRP